MKHLLNILIVLVLTTGLVVAFGGFREFCSGSCPTEEDPRPDVNEEVSNNDDAFDDYHDTFTIEELANNDDAFDDYHDTFDMEELA